MIRNRWWIHLATWAALYLFWVTVFQNHALTLSRTFTVEFCYLLFIAGNYYFQLFFAIPKLLYRKKYLAFGIALLGGLVMSSFLRTLLALYMNAHFFLPGGTRPAFSTV